MTSLPRKESLVTSVAPRVTRKTLRERIMASKGSVGWSDDLRRILALPRRPQPDLVALINEMTFRLKRPQGTQMLRPHQAWMLKEAPLAGGMLAQIRVGGGKCVDGDTEVFDVGNGRRRKVCELGEFTTYAKGEDGKFSIARATAVESGSKLCVRLTVRNGNSVVLSVDHPVFTQRGWVQASALCSTDLVAVPRKVPGPIQPLKVSDDEVKLAAYLIADGNVSHGGTSFTDDNETVIAELLDLSARLADAGQNLNSSCSKEGPRETESRSNAREFDLRGLSWFRRKWGINGLSKHKRIPAVFWGLNDRQTALFLNRFCACDGHVSERLIEVTLASEKLIDDIQFLLLRLGVMSRKRFKKATIGAKVYDAWRLTVGGEDVDRFFSTVGVILGSEGRCERLIEARRRAVTNTNVDIVPIRAGSIEVQQMFAEMGRAALRRKTAFNKAIGVHGGPLGGFVSRARFRRACDTFGYRGALYWLADSDLAWERFERLDWIGERPVYDLSVPGPTNFIGNGIVLHNTLAGLLMPMTFPSPEPNRTLRAVLFIPPSLRAQLLEHNWEFYGQHWKLPNLAGGQWFDERLPTVHVVAYSELSSQKSSQLLERIRPDLIVADECHHLKAYGASRVKRFLRFLEAFPETKFCGWSGTITSHGLQDYTHLSAIALGEGSPVPVETQAVEEWSNALNPEGLYNAGELRQFCEVGEDVRHGFRRRLTDTLGFVATGEDELGTSLTFLKREPPKSTAVEEHLKVLRRSPDAGGWKRPDGEELRTAMEVTACARELACGFYYQWTYPRGEPKEVRDTWFLWRQNWNRELRAKLANSAPHLDSPGLCENAAKRWLDGGCPGCERGPREYHQAGCQPSVIESHPLWDSYTYPIWRQLEDTVVHVTKTVWVDDWLLKDATAWMDEAPGIVWVEHVAFGEALAKVSGRPYYGGGKAASAEILHEDGTRSIIASETAHSEGKNLQEAFWRNLIVSVSPNAKLLEQVIGRTHRPGQPKDEVEVHFYQHVPELKDALEKARERARYVAETLGSDQKLVTGDWSW